ncbi:MAG: elongation factor P [Bacteroidales bacterium]
MAGTSDIKKGVCIEHNGNIFSVIEFLHVKPGKGAAFVRTKLKNVKTGKVVDNTFPSSAKITIVRVERRPYQYLYKDDAGYNFMNTETFEQILLEEGMIDNQSLLKEGLICDLILHAETETPLNLEMPANVEMEVTFAEPSEKGNTASSTALKQATVETGATIMVPLFINTGDTIKVDTSNNNYLERVKK